jgi:hypothetical protein
VSVIWISSALALRGFPNKLFEYHLLVPQSTTQILDARKSKWSRRQVSLDYEPTEAHQTESAWQLTNRGLVRIGDLVRETTKVWSLNQMHISTSLGQDPDHGVNNPKGRSKIPPIHHKINASHNNLEETSYTALTTSYDMTSQYNSVSSLSGVASTGYRVDIMRHWWAGKTNVSRTINTHENNLVASSLPKSFIFPKTLHIICQDYVVYNT